MRKIPQSQQDMIAALRMNGKSILEIVKETGTPKTTVQRYARKVQVLPEYRQALKEKQGGSKDRAQARRENVMIEAENTLREIADRDYLLLLIGLYWGEGTKRDFGIINSDPTLIQTFIICLSEFGIPLERLGISIRVHSDISIPDAKRFWAKSTGIPIEKIRRVEIIEGKKKGKLKYGMCRIRVHAGIRERLLLQSMISIIGKDSDKKIVSI